jgi:hypothetical protein
MRRASYEGVRRYVEGWKLEMLNSMTGSQKETTYKCMSDAVYERRALGKTRRISPGWCILAVDRVESLAVKRAESLEAGASRGGETAWGAKEQDRTWASKTRA